MKVMNWTVSGMRSRKYDGTDGYLRTNEYDVMLLQKTQTREMVLHKYLGDQMKVAVWDAAEQANYNGTGILMKQPELALSVRKGMNGPDPSGRVSTVEMPDFWLVSAFAPSAMMKKEDAAAFGTQKAMQMSMDAKVAWIGELTEYLKELDAVKPVVAGVCMQNAIEEIDVFSVEYCSAKPGFLPEEREAAKNLLSAGFTDVFRAFWPDRVLYDTWTAERMRKANQGSRRTLTLISNRYLPAVTACDIIPVPTINEYCATCQPYWFELN